MIFESKWRDDPLKYDTMTVVSVRSDGDTLFYSLVHSTPGSGTIEYAILGPRLGVRRFGADDGLSGRILWMLDLEAPEGTIIDSTKLILTNESGDSLGFFYHYEVCGRLNADKEYRSEMIDTREMFTDVWAGRRLSTRCYSPTIGLIRTELTGYYSQRIE